MKKLLMVLFVLVFSFALCVSVSAVEADVEDTAIVTEVAETASVSSDCNHVDRQELEIKDFFYVDSDWLSPTMCVHTYHVTYRCLDCDEVFTDGTVYTTTTNHEWSIHLVLINGTYQECGVCAKCGWHTRTHS
ncbi:MAG: hypothetical protein IJ449_01725 [Clostridia bacterium]|nr:hypothetical protein [Clostridia bacterium]